MKLFARTILLLSLFLLAACSSGTTYTNLQPEGALVKLVTADLKPMQAAFYQVELDGKQIRFFAVKGNDGQIRTALDACDVCFREKKGYEQKGDVMLCRNCNLTFPIDRIGPSSVGGCNPHFLPSRLEGDRLVIAVDELRKGARFFP